MVGRVALLVLVTGCELAFPLDDGELSGEDGEIPDEVPLDHCTPTTELGIRYAVAYNPTQIMWPWIEARGECLLRGMDLAVLNDNHELGMIDGDSFPVWVGATVDARGWAGVDGCAVEMTTAIQTAPGGAMCGVVTGSLALDATACDGATPTVAGMVNTALCETPRPTTEACIPGDPALATYTISETAMSHAQARTFCESIDARLAVMDTQAEWKRVGHLPSVLESRVWLGSSFDGTTWETETQCPAVYSWTTGRPDVSVGTCSTTSLATDSETQQPVVDGMTAVACTDAFFALCESR